MKTGTGIVFLALTLVILTSMKYSDIEPGYIKFHYNGEPTKPYPLILLYLEGSKEALRDTVYKRKLQISKESLISIRKVIHESGSETIDSCLPNKNTYYFFVDYNGETSFCFTPYVPRIRKIFDVIISEIDHPGPGKFIAENMRYTLRRLMYSIKGDCN